MNQLCLFFVYVFLTVFFRHLPVAVAANCLQPGGTGDELTPVSISKIRCKDRLYFLEKRFVGGKTSRWKISYPHISPLYQSKVSRQIMPDLSQVWFNVFFVGKKWSDKVWYLEDRAAKGAAWRETEIWAKQDQTKCLQVFCEGNLEKYYYSRIWPDLYLQTSYILIVLKRYLKHSETIKMA